LSRARSITAAITIVLSLGALADPVHAQTPPETTVATADSTVTFSVSDVQFDGPDCVQTPVILSYTKTGGAATLTRIGLTLNLNQSGATNGIGGTWRSDAYDPVTQSAVTTSLKVCPSKIDPDRGPLIVSGNLNTYGGSSGRLDSPVPNSTVTMAFNPTRLTRPKVKKVTVGFDWIYVSGDATATTITKGAVPAGGQLTLQVRKPGRPQWVNGSTTGTDNFGSYTFRLPYAEKYPKGTRYRVTLTKCGWCESKASVVVRR
jgi:hypothetical protein